MSVRVPKTLGSALRERRGQLRLSQQDVADKAGVDQKRIALIESGKVQRPHPKTLDAIEKAVDWPSGYAYRLRDGQVVEELDDDADRAREDQDLAILRAAYRRLGYRKASQLLLEMLHDDERGE